MAKSDPNRDKEAALIFHGKLTKLANYNNSSIEVERLNINSLMKKGWLVRLGKQRWRAGRWSTVQYLSWSTPSTRRWQNFRSTATRAGSRARHTDMTWKRANLLHPAN